MSNGIDSNFETFGDFVLLKLLASGGMAEVFLARPRNPNANGRVVILKRILRHIADDPVFIQMFRSEIRVTLGFNHPNTIQLHDFGEHDNQPYIVMEYIEGKSLKEIMTKFSEKSERIPVPTVLGLIAQAASGLSYAHHFENSVTGEVVNAIHRDISPHNLLVSYEGNLKVIDFGVAKAKNQLTETRVGQIKGKAGYLSPEQLSEDVLDGRSDVFSLGIVTWEFLTNQRLFQRSGDTEMKVLERIQNCEKHIIKPSVYNPEVPPEVDALILRVLAKNRDDRYSSAAEFQSELRAVMRKCYPYYSFSDTTQIMRVLFEGDMMLDRMVLREANAAAQSILAAELDAKTRVVQPESKGLIAGLFRGFRKKSRLPDEVELRVSRIENALKQKAGFRHVMMVVIYVLSIISIKLDERYELIGKIFLPAQADVTGNLPDPIISTVNHPEKLRGGKIRLSVLEPKVVPIVKPPLAKPTLVKVPLVKTPLTKGTLTKMDTRTHPTAVKPLLKPVASLKKPLRLSKPVNRSPAKAPVKVIAKKKRH